MIELIWLNLKQALRSRLVLTLLIFTFIIQYGGMRIASTASLYNQGSVIKFDHRDMLFVSLVFQLFNGMFLAALYGIWVVPQGHQGQRNYLTFVIPVPRWMFPLAYGITMLLMLLSQYGIALITYGLQFGWDVLGAAPWTGVVCSLVVETLAFLVVMFGFSVFSLLMGQLPTFVLGVLFLIVQQAAGVFFRLPLEGVFGDHRYLGVLRFVYYKLPPLGELVYNLRENYVHPDLLSQQTALWAAWLVLFLAVFQLRLRFPGQSRSADIV